MQLYFALVSWLWTLVLSYTIFCIISDGKVWLKMWQAYILCWIWPAILALLPLTTDKYSSGDPAVQWCLIVPRKDTPTGMTTFWAFASFFGWLFLCVALMSYWAILIRFRYWYSILHEVVRKTYEKVWLYPVAMSLCWILNFLAVNIPPTNQDPWVVGLSMLFGVANGIASTLIFVCNNRDVHQRWVTYFSNKDSPSLILAPQNQIRSQGQSLGRSTEEGSDGMRYTGADKGRGTEGDTGSGTSSSVWDGLGWQASESSPSFIANSILVGDFLSSDLFGSGSEGNSIGRKTMAALSSVSFALPPTAGTRGSIQSQSQMQRQSAGAAKSAADIRSSSEIRSPLSLELG